MKSDPVQEEREKCVRKYIPELFSGKFKSVLYIGANQKRQHFLEYFEKSNYERIVILEAFYENYEFLKKKFENNLPDVYQVILGDIRNLEGFSLHKFDVTFFWHGPEHLPENDIISTINKIELLTRRLVVLGMPFGHYEQGAEYGNPFEKHLSSIYPSMLEKLGYKTETIGDSDKIGSNITAWKHIKKNV